MYQRRCLVHSLQGPRLADTAFASAVSAMHGLPAGASLGSYGRDQLRDVEPMQRLQHLFPPVVLSSSPVHFG